jgi:RND family efflux transporter MFP subunit
MSRNKVIIICGGILLSAVVLVLLIYGTEPTAKSEAATKKTAMLVSVKQVSKGDFTPTFQATGTVQAFEDVSLNAQVSGQVIRRNPTFVPGGIVKKGTELLKIEPADYYNLVELRESELTQAQTNLEVEMGRQNIAEQDLSLIGGDSLNEQQRSLVLREPQLEAVRGQLKAAKASLEQARLNLQRTSVTAPFDARIISQNVSVGSQVSPGDNLGRLVGIENYWVEVSIPVKKLKWLRFPQQDERGAEVIIKNSTDWEEGESRSGYLESKVGALDRRSRLARVLIKIPQPVAGDTAEGSGPELMIGSFIEAYLKGEKVKNVVPVERDFIRTGNTVWVMRDGLLEIRPVKIKLMDATHAFISEGLEEGELIVTSNISTVTDGIPLRTETESSKTNSTDGR